MRPGSRPTGPRCAAGAARPTADRQGAARPPAHTHLAGRPALRAHRYALPFRRPDHWLGVARTCRAVAGANPPAGRHRRPRRFAGHKAKAVRRATRDVGARLLFLPCFRPPPTPSSRPSQSSGTGTEMHRRDPSRKPTGPSETSSSACSRRIAPHSSNSRAALQPETGTL